MRFEVTQIERSSNSAPGQTDFVKIVLIKHLVSEKDLRQILEMMGGGVDVVPSTPIDGLPKYENRPWMSMPHEWATEALLEKWLKNASKK